MSTALSVCTAAKVAWLRGVHLPGDAYKIALYGDIGSLTASTEAYGPEGEVPDGRGYQTGGKLLEGFFVSSNGTSAFLTWNAPTWDSASFTASGALVYNASRNNSAIAVLDFGGSHTPIGHDFSLDFSRLICIS
jgi:hypothetical protein